MKSIGRRFAVGHVASAVFAVFVFVLASVSVAVAAPAGEVLIAGYDGYGQLGISTSTEYITSLEGAPLWGPTLAVQAAGAEYNNYVLLANGTVEAAGSNEYGGNGLGSESGVSYVPKVIPGLSGVSEVAAGWDHFGLAVLSDGSVDSWGYGYSGELGNGENGAAAQENSPAPIAGLEHVRQVAAGCFYAMALLANGTVEAWGWGGDGELGNGGTAEAKTPQAVPGLSNVVAIASGCYTSYALLANGEVMSWGSGSNGQLGNGTTTVKQLTPVEVTGVEGATEISAGYYSGYARLSNGTVKDWGYNNQGELGDGTTAEHTEPELVPGLTGVAKITAASEAAYATLSDGSVDGWGYGYYGELANGKKEAAAEERSPTPIAGLSNVISIATGDYDYSLMAIEGSSATLSASSLAFAGQTVGTESAGQTVTLTNTGPAPMAISGDALSGTGAGSFLKSADTCQGQTIAAGSACSISFAFKPSAAGSETASLTLTTSAANTLPAVTLTGTGTEPVLPTPTLVPLPAPRHGTAHALRSVTVKGADAKVKLACTGKGACDGSLELVARVHSKGHGKHHRHGRTRNVVIGTASFSIAKGGYETLQVALNAKGRALLSNAGRQGLKVRVKGHDVKTRTVVLKASRKAHRHAARSKRPKKH